MYRQCFLFITWANEIRCTYVSRLSRNETKRLTNGVAINRIPFNVISLFDKYETIGGCNKCWSSRKGFSNDTFMIYDTERADEVLAIMDINQQPMYNRPSLNKRGVSVTGMHKMMSDKLSMR